MGLTLFLYHLVGKSVLKEEEIEGCPTNGNPFGITDGGVVTVLDSAVALDITNGGVILVLNGAITLDVTSGGMILVLNGAVTLDVAHCRVIAVLNSAIALDVADGGMIAVLDSAVALHIANGGVILVLQILCTDGHAGKKEQQENSDFLHRYRGLTECITENFRFYYIVSEGNGRMRVYRQKTAPYPKAESR